MAINKEYNRKRFKSDPLKMNGEELAGSLCKADLIRLTAN